MNHSIYRQHITGWMFFGFGLFFSMFFGFFYKPLISLFLVITAVSFIIIGSITILFDLIFKIYSKSKRWIYNFVVSLIEVVIGVLLLSSKGTYIVSVVCGIVLIILAGIDLFLYKKAPNHIFKDCIRFFLAIMLFTQKIQFVILIIVELFCLFCVIYGLCLVISKKKLPVIWVSSINKDSAQENNDTSVKNTSVIDTTAEVVDEKKEEN